MKLPVVLLILFMTTVSADRCSGLRTGPVYKARMEIKGICRNYTFHLLEGTLDTTQIERNWKDETTGKIHKDVFGVSNPCHIPESMKESDIFYFSIDSSAPEDCIVCEAYYPTPAKKIRIKIINR
jgi:hypothetical protein